MPKASKTAQNYIKIKNARVHNLKGISLDIPRNQFITITGLSGSGKSSLAFDTLYAEGQRRYVESLSAYARQFLGRMNKPEVDYIKGIPPAIAIEQKVNTRNPRSTVGTSTEVYEYIKILFARIGKTFSPISGNLVIRHRISDVTNEILALPLGEKVILLAPCRKSDDRTMAEQLETLNQQGFSRIELDGKIQKIADVKGSKSKKCPKNLFIVIDRIVVKTNDDELQARIDDSVQTAFYEGGDVCFIRTLSDKKLLEYSNKFEADGIVFEEPDTNMFSYNNPVGACPVCEGFGKVMGIDEDLVVPNKSLSIYEEAIACWRGEKMSWYKQQLVMNSSQFDFPIHKPFSQLTDAQRQLLWDGNQYFTGLTDFFKYLETESYKIQNRVMLSRYRGKTTCPECKGTRLKKEAAYVKVAGKSIHELVLLSLADLRIFFSNLLLNEHDQQIAKRLLIEINNRLDFLNNVGLGYLNLNRLSSTLSGGESQRINLATSLGSSLVGSLYILDEPSIGLHSRDTQNLIDVLKRLQKIGNTVLVVEHDEEIIRAADHLIDIGPLAGVHGGEIVYEGTIADFKDNESLTLKYLTGQMQVAVPEKRRPWKKYIEIKGARENNLKGIDARFPLGVLTVVTGVSGSGKSTLVKQVLYAALNNRFNSIGMTNGKFDSLEGDLASISQIEFVDQNPIGKSSRSNPVTYLKAYDEIRKLFASQQASKINLFQPSHFSFNVEGGRCEECQGEGTIKVEMQFMADVKLVCEHCGGKRFKDDVLEVHYQDKNIYDILELTVDEALEFFGKDKNTLPKKIVQKIQPLADVGLGYVKLGQASSTLSGGESQRIKLASYLSMEHATQKAMFIFDEPTTGLHFHDINKLLSAFDALIARGHSILVIEHNMDIIKYADWVIDLGPEGGEKGGNLVFAGTPEELSKCKGSYTAAYLQEKLNHVTH